MTLSTFKARQNGQCKLFLNMLVTNNLNTFKWKRPSSTTWNIYKRNVHIDLAIMWVRQSPTVALQEQRMCDSNAFYLSKYAQQPKQKVSRKRQMMVWICGKQQSLMDITEFGNVWKTMKCGCHVNVATAKNNQNKKKGYPFPSFIIPSWLLEWPRPTNPPEIS